MVWLYDDQPGVVVRASWSAPWHDHHYYPYTGQLPRLGRYENLSAPSHPSKPAQTYRRTWSNNWAFEHSPVILPPKLSLLSALRMGSAVVRISLGR